MPTMIKVQLRKGYNYKNHRAGDIITISVPEWRGLKHIFEDPKSTPKAEVIGESVSDRSMRSPRSGAERLKRE